MTMWGIHNDELSEELLSQGFISIGWEIGDLSIIGDDPDRIKELLAADSPGAKPRAVASWAGTVRRFAFDMAVGDIVIFPGRADRTLNFGEVTGGYEYHPEVERHRHRRPVRWIKTGVPRGIFPKAALYEIGSVLTLFKVRRHAHIFREFLNSSSEDEFLGRLQEREEASPVPVPNPVQAAAPTEAERDEEASDSLPTAEQIQENTNDFITRTLLEDLTHKDFEYFVADLLRAMGYQARVTRYSVDGGVDVLAHRDVLGLEPPLIKVQCKHTTATRGRPDIQGLLGGTGGEGRTRVVRDPGRLQQRGGRAGTRTAEPSPARR